MQVTRLQAHPQIDHQNLIMEGFPERRKKYQLAEEWKEIWVTFYPLGLRFYFKLQSIHVPTVKMFSALYRNISVIQTLTFL